MNTKQRKKSRIERFRLEISFCFCVWCFFLSHDLIRIRIRIRILFCIRFDSIRNVVENRLIYFELESFIFFFVFFFSSLSSVVHLVAYVVQQQSAEHMPSLALASLGLTWPTSFDWIQFSRFLWVFARTHTLAHTKTKNVCGLLDCSRRVSFVSRCSAFNAFVYLRIYAVWCGRWVGSCVCV